MKLKPKSKKLEQASEISSPNLNVNKPNSKLDPLSPDHELTNRIIQCTTCSRLRAHCRAVARGETLPRKAFIHELKAGLYWEKPVPDFGITPSKLLIVGLAPAAHGANRTGRMFTGDDSGKWLYRALFRAGFAQTEGYEKVGDNKLIDTCITAVAHCAPPDNKPSNEEILNCHPFLVERFRLARPRVIIALGAIAWKASITTLKMDLSYTTGRDFKFLHGKSIEFTKKNEHPLSLIGSYHPSRQNTNTGRLTELMLDQIFQQARKLLGHTSDS